MIYIFKSTLGIFKNYYFIDKTMAMSHQPKQKNNSEFYLQYIL